PPHPPPTPRPYTTLFRSPPPTRPAAPHTGACGKPPPPGGVGCAETPAAEGVSGLRLEARFPSRALCRGTRLEGAVPWATTSPRRRLLASTPPRRRSRACTTTSSAARTTSPPTARWPTW